MEKIRHSVQLMLHFLHHIEQAGFFVQPVFVYVLYGGDERDISPVGHALHAATLHARADERI